jgi:hypothetical protein
LHGEARRERARGVVRGGVPVLQATTQKTKCKKKKKKEKKKRTFPPFFLNCGDEGLAEGKTHENLLRKGWSSTFCC